MVLCCALLAVGSSGEPQSQEPAREDSTSQAQRDFTRELAALSSPRLRERQIARRELQRAGYANILYDLERHDPLSALISYARATLQVELHIPHTTLYIYVPVRYPASRDSTLPGFTGAPSPPIAIPLPDDWSFPADPWERK